MKTWVGIVVQTQLQLWDNQLNALIQANWTLLTTAQGQYKGKWSPKLKLPYPQQVQLQRVITAVYNECAKSSHKAERYMRFKNLNYGHTYVSKIVFQGKLFPELEQAWNDLERRGLIDSNERQALKTLLESYATKGAKSHFWSELLGFTYAIEGLELEGLRKLRKWLRLIP
jgi:hypothetical protein